LTKGTLFVRKLVILSTVFLALLATLAVACGGGDDNDSSSDSTSRSGAGADVAPANSGASGGSAASVQEVALKTGENGQAYFFNPSEVKLKPGQVKVSVTNDGPERPHNFVVKNLNGSGDLAMLDRLNPGQSGSVTFQVAAGTYQFICSLPGHADRGAKGTLVVS
jgi:plastocyanin